MDVAEVKDTKSKITQQAVEERGGHLVPAGSFLFSFKLTVGQTAFLGIPAYINEAIAAFEPNRYIDLKFWSYAASQIIPRYARENIYGAAILNQDLIGSARFYAPSWPEQRQIADFLDHETARIDALIEEQQRLIKLLEEKRQTVVSRAVTEGIDTGVPTQESGVDWLGRVPAHWTIKKLIRCARIAEGQVDPKLEPFAQMKLVAPNHIESVTGRVWGVESADSQGAESGKYFCYAGDVLYSKIRPALRKACLAEYDCLCSADIYPLRPLPGVTSRFLLWTILSEPFSRLTVLESERVAMPKINREALSEIRLAIPPLDEQREIADFIERTVQELDRLQTVAENAINYLRERRSALIADATTGKIDVRNWQPPKVAGGGGQAATEAVE